MDIPSIGREIPWSNVVGQVFHVIEFDNAGTTIGPDDELVTKGVLQPYGFLLVESPFLAKELVVRLPITHRDDYLLASSVFDDPNIGPHLGEVELLVTYLPKKKHLFSFGGTRHSLHYVMTPKGTLQKYYHAENGRYSTNPNPERIFGTFKWDGLIKVEVNKNPDIGN